MNLTYDHLLFQRVVIRRVGAGRVFADTAGGRFRVKETTAMAGMVWVRGGGGRVGGYVHCERLDRKF